MAGQRGQDLETEHITFIGFTQTKDDHEEALLEKWGICCRVRFEETKTFFLLLRFFRC
jgi:hypothetical protein